MKGWMKNRDGRPFALMLALLLTLASASQFMSRKALAITDEELRGPPQFSFATLEIPNDPRYYGSAVLFKATPERTYFLTAAHVVEGKNLESRLVLHSLALNGLAQRKLLKSPCQAAPAELCSRIRIHGTLPDEDIAVISVEHARPLPPNDSEIESANRIVEMRYSSSFIGRDRIEKLDAAVVGLTRKLSAPPSGRFFYESLRMPWSTDHMRTQLMPFVRDGQVTERTEIRRTYDCPTSKMSECLLFDIPTFGYSGGILIAKPDPRTPPRIIGMVTHFAGGSYESFAIPIEQALKAGNRILGLGTKAPRVYVAQAGKAGTFAMPAGGWSQGGGGWSQGGGGRASVETSIDVPGVYQGPIRSSFFEQTPNFVPSLQKIIRYRDRITGELKAPPASTTLLTEKRGLWLHASTSSNSVDELSSRAMYLAPRTRLEGDGKNWTVLSSPSVSNSGELMRLTFDPSQWIWDDAYTARYAGSLTYQVAGYSTQAKAWALVVRSPQEPNIHRLWLFCMQDDDIEPRYLQIISAVFTDAAAH